MAVTGTDLIAIAEATFGAVGQLKKLRIPSVSIDSRTMETGAVFFAIRGEVRDGHDFVRDAGKKAAAVVVEETWWNSEGSKIQDELQIPVIIVGDTVKALGRLAHRHRQKFTIPMVAITGSSGKTTTKEMIVHILKTKYNVHHTKGNYNNHLGVPITVCDLEETHEISVIEIAMNHPGEIEYLCQVAEPTHGLITNIGKGHIGYFGSVEEIAREKGMLFRWIERDSTRVAIVNADDQQVVNQAETIENTVRYGVNSKNVDVSGSIVSRDAAGRYTFSFRTRKSRDHFVVRLPVPGKHQVFNALAAATVGMSLGVASPAICRALAAFTPPEKRSVLKDVGGVTMVDDTYNANPDSMQAALEMFRDMQVSGKKILILGDMLELGTLSEEEHRRIGLMINEMGFEHVFTYGQESETTYAVSSAPTGGHYDHKNDLVDDVLKIVKRGDAILIKGSRGMRMEEIVGQLEKSLAS